MRSRLRRTVVPASLAVVAALALPSLSYAQATRTWVDGETGDDANPCSITAPCKTFAGAESKTATGGEINVDGPGGYGAVTITKALTISATGVTAGVIVAGTDGIVINTSGDTASPGDPDRDMVTLRGLDIDGLGAHTLTAGLTGVEIQHAGTVRLEDDEIYGFADSGVAFSPSDTTEAGAPVSSLYVEGSIIHDNGQAGVLALAPAGQSARVVIEDSQIENNGCGLAAGISAAAVFSTADCGTASTGTGTIEIDTAASSMSGNTGAGVQSDGSNATNELADDVVTGNGTGLQELAAGQITSVGADNSVFGNSTDGSPTSTQSTGAVGPAGANGANGLNGEIELITCKTVTVTVTKKVHGKRRKLKKNVQKCVGKLVSGKVKFTTAGDVVKATLSRAGILYASGTVRIEGAAAQGALRVRRRLSRGGYTLSFWKGGRIHSRRFVVER